MIKKLGSEPRYFFADSNSVSEILDEQGILEEHPHHDFYKKYILDNLKGTFFVSPEEMKESILNYVPKTASLSLRKTAEPETMQENFYEPGKSDEWSKGPKRPRQRLPFYNYPDEQGNIINIDPNYSNPMEYESTPGPHPQGPGIFGSLSMRKVTQHITKQLFYDFYGVSLLSDQYLEQNPYASQYKDMIVQQVKEVYVPLITKSIYKALVYACRGVSVCLLDWNKWKKEFNIKNLGELKNLPLEQVSRIWNEGKWNKWMKSRVLPWGDITESLIQLINTTDTNQLITIIDHINDIQHNTGILLEDFPALKGWVAEALEIKAGATPEQLLLYLSTDIQKFVTEDLQLRGQEVIVPEKYLTGLDKSRLASNPRTPPETLVELAKDEDPGIRWEVAKNKNTLFETLTELVKDKEDFVRDEAKKRLKELKEFASKLNMRKKAQSVEYILEKLNKFKITNLGDVRLFIYNIASNVDVSEHLVNGLILDNMKRFPSSFIENWKVYVTDEYGLGTFTEKLAHEKIGEALGEWYRSFYKEPVENLAEDLKLGIFGVPWVKVPFSDFLNKYTEDEIWDIASGKKTDVTEEEIEQAKEVIQRGIVANKLSMRKEADDDWKQRVYNIIDRNVFREGVSESIQKDGQKVLDAITKSDIQTLEQLLLKYDRDKGIDEGGGGAGPGKVPRARRGAVSVWNASQLALDKLELEKQYKSSYLNKLNMRKTAQNKVTTKDIKRFYDLERKGLLTDEFVDDIISKLIYGIQEATKESFTERVVMEKGEQLENAYRFPLSQKIIVVDQIIHLYHMDEMPYIMDESEDPDKVDKVLEDLFYGYQVTLDYARLEIKRLKSEGETPTVENVLYNLEDSGYSNEKINNRVVKELLESGEIQQKKEAFNLNMREFEIDSLNQKETLQPDLFSPSPEFIENLRFKKEKSKEEQEGKYKAFQKPFELIYGKSLKETIRKNIEEQFIIPQQLKLRFEKSAQFESQTTKQQLKRLYKQEAKGIYDEELMDQIIVDFINTIEGLIKFDEKDLKLSKGAEDEQIIHNIINDEKKMLQILQQATTPQEKMIAIDRVINTAHEFGVYGEYLITDIKSNDLFFEELSNLKVSSLNLKRIAQTEFKPGDEVEFDTTRYFGATRKSPGGVLKGKGIIKGKAEEGLYNIEIKEVTNVADDLVNVFKPGFTAPFAEDELKIKKPEKEIKKEIPVEKLEEKIEEPKKELIKVEEPKEVLKEIPTPVEEPKFTIEEEEEEKIPTKEFEEPEVAFAPTPTILGEPKEKIEEKEEKPFWQQLVDEVWKEYTKPRTLKKPLGSKTLVMRKTSVVTPSELKTVYELELQYRELEQKYNEGTLIDKEIRRFQRIEKRLNDLTDKVIRDLMFFFKDYLEWYERYPENIREEEGELQVIEEMKQRLGELNSAFDINSKMVAIDNVINMMHIDFSIIWHLKIGYEDYLDRTAEEGISKEQEEKSNEVWSNLIAFLKEQGKLKLAPKLTQKQKVVEKLSIRKQSQQNLTPEEEVFVKDFVKQFEHLYNAEEIYENLFNEKPFILDLTKYLEEDLKVLSDRCVLIALAICDQLKEDFEGLTSLRFGKKVRKYKGPFKSILEDVAQDVWKALDLTEAKNIVLNRVGNSQIDEEDKQTIINNVNRINNLLDLQKYIANSILAYEGMGTKLSMRKTSIEDSMVINKTLLYFKENLGIVQTSKSIYDFILKSFPELSTWEIERLSELILGILESKEPNILVLGMKKEAGIESHEYKYKGIHENKIPTYTFIGFQEFGDGKIIMVNCDICQSTLLLSPEEAKPHEYQIEGLPHGWEKEIKLSNLQLRKKAQENEPPSPYPQVTKQELRRLYKQEAKGIYDEELEDVIISKFMQTLKEGIRWCEWIIIIEPKSEKGTKERIEDEEKLIQILQKASTPQEKMIAIDRVINIAHEFGYYGEYLIIDVGGGNDPFFDELSNLKISSLLSLKKKAETFIYDEPISNEGSWAIYKGNVYITYSPGKRHPNWFEEIGLPSVGEEFDNIVRGYFYDYAFGSKDFKPEEKRIVWYGMGDYNEFYDHLEELKNALNFPPNAMVQMLDYTTQGITTLAMRKVVQKGWGNWAIYKNKVYTIEGDIEHTKWFAEIGLPSYSKEYDKICRGVYSVGRVLWYSNTGTFEEFSDNLPKLLETLGYPLDAEIEMTKEEVPEIVPFVREANLITKTFSYLRKLFSVPNPILKSLDYPHSWPRKKKKEKTASNKLSISDLNRFYNLEAQGLLTRDFVDDILSKLLYGLQKGKDSLENPAMLEYMEEGIVDLEKATTSKDLYKKIIAIDQVIHFLHSSLTSGVFQGDEDEIYDTLSSISEQRLISEDIIKQKGNYLNMRKTSSTVSEPTPNEPLHGQQGEHPEGEVYFQGKDRWLERQPDQGFDIKFPGKVKINRDPWLWGDNSVSEQTMTASLNMRKKFAQDAKSEDPELILQLSDSNKLPIQELKRFYELEEKGLLPDEFVDEVISKLIYGVEQEIKRVSKNPRVEAPSFLSNMKMCKRNLESTSLKDLNEKIIAVDWAIHYLHIGKGLGVFQGDFNEIWKTLESIGEKSELKKSSKNLNMRKASTVSEQTMTASLSLRKKFAIPRPQVTKKELKRLYIQEAKGLYDEELEDEIISKFIDTFEKLKKNYTEALDPKTPTYVEDEEVAEYMRKNIEEIPLLINILQIARTPQEKMIAIDNVINTMHAGGRYGEYLIQGVYIGTQDPFFEELSNLKISKVLNMRKASILDYPQKHLDPEMWDLSGDLPKLKEDVKNLIIKRFIDYLKKEGLNSPELWCKGFYYTGSTATYRYLKTSDIDIHVEIDWDIYKENNLNKAKDDNEEMRKDLLKVFWNTLNKEKLPGTSHPLTYYILSAKESVLTQGEEAYDILNDKWIVSPQKIPENLDVSDKIKLLQDKAEGIMKKLDEELGKTKRDLIDYNILKELVSSYEGDKEDIQKLIEKKLEDIEQGLKQLQKENEQIHEERNKAFYDGQEPIEKGLSKNWTPGNILFKLIERYRYLDILRKIKHIIKDDQVTEDETKELENVLIPKLSMRKTSQLDKQLFYDFYGVSLLSDQYLEANPYASQYKDMIVQQVKEEYVPLITKMVYDEFKNAPWAALDWGKWVTKFNVEKIKDLTLEQLAQIYNEGKWYTKYGGKPWGEITISLIELKETTDTNQLITIIDHINDIQHNTGLMFHDFPKVEKWFSDALEIKKFSTPEQLIPYLSLDLQKFVIEDLQLKGQETIKPEKYVTVSEKIELAANPSTPPEILIELAKDENVDIRREVASNLNTPLETLIELTKDEDRYVRWYTVNNQSIPLEIRKELRKQYKKSSYLNNLSMRKTSFLTDNISEIPENWVSQDKTDNKKLRRTNPPRHDKNDSIVEHNLDPHIDLASLNLRKKAFEGQPKEYHSPSLLLREEQSPQIGTPGEATQLDVPGTVDDDQWAETNKLRKQKVIREQIPSDFNIPFGYEGEEIRQT